ncbi:hypothetical protein DI53_3839 [Sphingobacterium deserti]|uniref:Uncharacterized protein n=1 Tax=Sphingobacterium deserti TaxID=1229276 RepID=A0A0B8T5W7_9SPHI|nr:hypothetical protein DI53_3839 [Sphingobacterium deserti]
MRQQRITKKQKPDSWKGPAHLYIAIEAIYIYYLFRYEITIFPKTI